jgi:hypothetical protein
MRVLNSITADLAIGIAGLIVGVIGLIVAWYQYNGKRKLALFSKTTLRGMAGNIAKIQQSTAWARTNTRDAHNTAALLPDSELKITLLKFLSNGMGDATATDRLVTNLFNDALTMQESQFKTRIVKHPERDILNLYIMEQAQLPQPQPTEIISAT